MPSIKRFSVSAKNYFLTYPHCSLTPAEALSQLQNLNTSQACKKFIRVCQERQEDGSPRLHVLIQFEGKYRCKNPQFFDLVSPTRSAHFHPDIQGAKSSSDVKAYIEKDVVFVDWGNFQIDARSARGNRAAVAGVYAEAFNSNSKEEALRIIRERAPRSYVLQFHKISTKADKIFQIPLEKYTCPFSASSFNNVPDGIEEWAATNVTHPTARPDKPKSIVIEGPSRTGKTEWARSLGPHNYLCGYLDLNSNVFSNDAWYNVIDNVNPNYLKHWKEFFGAQKDWQSKIKYGRKPVQIKGGIPTIFLCNPGSGSSYSTFLNKEKNASLREWTLGNADFFFISDPFYSTQHQSPAPES